MLKPLAPFVYPDFTQESVPPLGRVASPMPDTRAPQMSIMPIMP